MYLYVYEYICMDYFKSCHIIFFPKLYVILMYMYVKQIKLLYWKCNYFPTYLSIYIYYTCTIPGGINNFLLSGINFMIGLLIQ